LDLFSRLVVHVDGRLRFVGRHEVAIVEAVHAAALVLRLRVIQLEFAGVRLVVKGALLLLL